MKIRKMNFYSFEKSSYKIKLKSKQLKYLALRLFIVKGLMLNLYLIPPKM